MRWFFGFGFSYQLNGLVVLYLEKHQGQDKSWNGNDSKRVAPAQMFCDDSSQGNAKGAPSGIEAFQIPRILARFSGGNSAEIKAVPPGAYPASPMPMAILALK